MVVKDYFDYHNVKLENVHLLNKDCAAFEEVVSGITYFSAATRSDNYTLCGGRTPEKNVTHITYSNTLYSGNKTEGQIVRQPQVEIIFKCVYPYMRRVSLPFPIAPYSSEMVLRVKQLEATVVMRLYKSSTFKEAYTSTPVLHLRDRVYVGVQITDPENFFALRVNECWATQTPDPNASQSFNHVLIDNGCVKDETVTFLNGTDGRGGANGEGSAVYYSFDMFRFVVQPFDLYLHCRVQLCTPNYDEQCVPVSLASSSHWWGTVLGSGVTV
ncbi:UROM protein, partial [Atractosteus spatula]|nr:UROM protein [Atractosteus spatula]